MARQKEPIKITCPNCNTQFVDVDREKVRKQLSDAGKKRQMGVTNQDRIRYSAKGQKTRMFHREQRARHEALGREYVRGNVIDDQEWAAEVANNPKLSQIQQPAP